MSDIPDKRFFRPDKVARILEQPVRTVYFWLKQDKIKHVHFGRKTVIPRDEIQRLIESGV
jgi:excisionase family DNA binding protein